MYNVYLIFECTLYIYVCGNYKPLIFNLIGIVTMKRVNDDEMLELVELIIRFMCESEEQRNILRKFYGNRIISWDLKDFKMDSMAENINLLRVFFESMTSTEVHERFLKEPGNVLMAIIDQLSPSNEEIRVDKCLRYAIDQYEKTSDVSNEIVPERENEIHVDEISQYIDTGTYRCELDESPVTSTYQEVANPCDSMAKSEQEIDLQLDDFFDETDELEGAQVLVRQESNRVPLYSQENRIRNRIRLHLLLYGKVVDSDIICYMMNDAEYQYQSSSYSKYVGRSIGPFGDVPVKETCYEPLQNQECSNTFQGYQTAGYTTQVALLPDRYVLDDAIFTENDLEINISEETFDLAKFREAETTQYEHYNQIVRNVHDIKRKQEYSDNSFDDNDYKKEMSSTLDSGINSRSPISSTASYEDALLVDHFTTAQEQTDRYLYNPTQQLRYRYNHRRSTNTFTPLHHKQKLEFANIPAFDSLLFENNCAIAVNKETFFIPPEHSDVRIKNVYRTTSLDREGHDHFSENGSFIGDFDQTFLPKVPELTSTTGGVQNLQIKVSREDFILDDLAADGPATSYEGQIQSGSYSDLEKFVTQRSLSGTMGGVIVKEVKLFYNL